MKLVTLIINTHNLLGTKTHPDIVESVTELEKLYAIMTDERDALRTQYDELRTQYDGIRNRCIELAVCTTHQCEKCRTFLE